MKKKILIIILIILLTGGAFIVGRQVGLNTEDSKTKTVNFVVKYRQIFVLR